MWLINKRSFLVMLFCITYVLVNAQSLYWVGGSGNFNDPHHWSTSSGGTPGTSVPTDETDVIFDNKSWAGTFTDPVITFTGNNRAKSFSVVTDLFYIEFKGSASSKLTLSGDITLNALAKYNANTTLVLNSSSAEAHRFLTWQNKLQSNVIFKGGVWDLFSFEVLAPYAVSVEAGTIRLNHSMVKAQNILINKNAVNIESFKGTLFSTGKLKIKNVNYGTSDLKIVADFSDTAKVTLGTDPPPSVKLSPFSLMAACTIDSYSYTNASCAGACDASLAVTINTSCATGPYDLFFNTAASCISNVMGSNSTTVNAGTFTLGGLCSFQCLGNLVDISLEQGATTFTILSNQSLPQQPTPINLNLLSSTQPSCAGQCNGSQLIRINGGNGPYTVNVNPGLLPSGPTFTIAGLTNTVITGLCGGVQTYSITDSQGCSTSINNFLVPTPSINIATSTRSIVCNGVCAGVFSIVPTGGAPNYTVTFSGGSTGTTTASPSNTIVTSGLCAGVVSATVTDTKGCKSVASNNIVEPPTLSVTPTQTNVTCGGLCDGSASVTVSGGTAPYTYTWSPVTASVAGVTALCAGPYTVNIKDNNNCTYSPLQTFTITQPPPITITPTIINVSCNGLTNGSAAVTATGGVAAINFTWVASGNTTVSTTPFINAVGAGTYVVFASDGNCVVNRTVTISQPPPLTITAITQSIVCIGICTGAATVNVAGGNGGPFTYTWNTVPVQNTQVISNLCIGTYSASVRDASNCPTSIQVTITQPNVFTPFITSASLTCNGVCNGTIGANPSGGTLPYSYTLTSATSTATSASPTFTGLCAGVYTLSIRDASSPCPQLFTVNIAEPAPIIPSISTTSITCFNKCDGVLTGNAIGGVPGYFYNWLTPTGPASGAGLINRCIGNYTLNVTDSRGCVKSTSLTLGQPTDITFTINPSHVTCFSNCNGALSANVAGGTPGYTLNWSNGFTGVPNTSLCVGVYTLTINDLNHCPKTGTAAIISPGIIALSQTTAPTACAGSCDGSATIAATGGASSFTFDFNTSPVITNTTGIINGLCAGSYIANVTDANGCSQATNFSIGSPVALSAAITNIKGSCSNCTGASTVTASNGLPAYSYVWTNSLSATVSTTNTASTMCPGNYTVVVTDLKNCNATTTVNIPETVVAAAVSGGTGIQCFGACTGSAVVSPIGGSAPYSYTWQPTGQTTQTATALCADLYTVFIKEGSASGCITSSTINIVGPPQLIVSGTKTDASCAGVCNGSITTTVSGGTGLITYSWSPGGQATSSITNLCAGTYSLRVTDANGCAAPTQTFVIDEPITISATFTTVAPTTCTLANGSICASAIGGSGGPYTYTWLPSASNATCINGLAAGAYSLIVSDGTVGCTSTITTLLNNPTSPALTPISSQSVTCFGGSNGAATYSASGTGPFVFSWSPAVSFTTTGSFSSASGLSGGSYVLSAVDANSCVRSIIVPVVQATSLTVNAAITNPKCNNAVCNGSIVVANPTGGTPGYTYLWSPGGATTQNLPNICAGIYSLTITDSHACPNMLTYTVAAPPVFSITTTSGSIKCNGVCNGSIVANALGGTAPVSYNWPAIGAFTGSTTATVLNLCSGIYTVNATDGNGCFALGTNTVQITEPAILTSTLQLQNATCSNSCNAVATQTASGGVIPYAFSWSSGAVTTATLDNLCAGNYTGFVTDANGCVAGRGFTVVPPTLFTVALVPGNPKCNPLSNPVCSGSVATTISGAQGAVTFNWLPVGSGQNPVNLCSGTYTLNAIDGNACQAIQVVNLVDPPALLSNVTFTDPACSGVCNGKAITTPTNAIGAVSVTWTPAAPNSPTVSSLCAGNYTVTIADNNGCMDVQTFTLTNPPALNVNTSNSAASCTLANGVITAIASGGSPGPGGYNYTWTPAVSTTSVASGLAASIYTLVVADALNCTNTVVIPLSNANGPTSAPIISSNIACNAQCTGAASINVSSISGGTPGGVSGYTVSWLAPPSSSTVNPQINLCAGLYTAKINDANNCVLFNSIIISQPNPVSTLPNMSFPTCMGVCNGSVSLNTSGGTGPYTYTWMPGTSSTSVLTNACPGNYTVLVGYGGVNNCTSTPQVFNLPAVTDIDVTTAVTPNPCFGNCNGIATITSASGIGSSQFDYAWSNGQNGITASNFCNGNYSVVVTAPNGCTNTFSIGVTSPAQITSTVVTTPPSCGNCNGASIINTSGGVGPAFSYSWTTGATAPSVSNLCAGLYQVVVTDAANGCKQTETVVVNNSNGITGEIFNTNNILCAGNCNGATTVTAIGGTSPITYNWLSPSVSGPVLNNLCAGTYFVQMSDAAGCIRTSSVIMSAATSLTLTPFIQQPGCVPVTQGSISVIVTGGAPAYTYSWQPTGATTSTLGGLNTGIYTLTVTESSPAHCALTQAYNISNLAGPVVTFTQTNISCFGACTGAITAATTGAGIATYHWSNGSNTPALTNLCSGPITLTVTGANGCVTIRSFTITENPALQINTPQITQPNCNLCNGGSTVTPFGGVLPYTYSWTTNSTGPAVTNLCAGIYQVTIADAVACQQTYTILVNNSNGITGQNFNVQNVLCGGNCNGSATVSAVGPNAPFSYNWITPVSTNSVINNLCTGIYFVQMSDAQNCIRTASVEITAATSVSIASVVNSPNCNASNGSINLTISGGTPTYAVQWFPGSNTTPTLSGISAGSYTVTVHDTPPGSCTVTEVFNVSNSTAPVITFTQSNVKCFGTCTGSINTVAAVAGNPAPNLVYAWSNGSNDASVSSLCQGIITVTVTNTGTGCKAIKSFTITENTDININSPSVTQPSCNMCNGAANVSVFGGITPYQYVWTNNATTPSIIDLCAGLYQVQVTDGLGCIKTHNVLINSSNGITGETFNLQNIQCANQCNGAATVTAVGGTQPINYSWVNPAITGPSINSLCAGDYFVQMTDAQGCIRTASVAIASPNAFTVSALVIPPTCGVIPANGSVNISVVGGSGLFQYSWTPSGSTAPLLSNVAPGSYSVIVTDANSGCSTQKDVTVSNPTGPDVTFVQTDISCFGSCTGSIVAASTSTNALTYSWSTGTVASGVASSTVTNLCKGVVTVTITDNVTGCQTVKTFNLDDNTKLQLSVPNVIQPSCHNACDGQITLLPSGGSLPYISFNWLPTGSSNNPQTALCAGNGASQVYTVIIEDAKGCTSTTSIVLNNPALMALSYSLTNPSCSAVADGSIGITPTGGTPTYSANWSGPAFTSTITSITNLFPGTYSLNLQDQKGCARDTTFELIPTVSVQAMAGPDATVCPTGSVVLSGTSSAGTGSLTYSWFLNTNTLTPLSTVDSLVILGATDPSTFILQVTSSVTGCFSRDEVILNILPVPSIDAGPTFTIPVYSTVTIGGNPTAFGDVTILWTPSLTLNDPTIQNPVASNTVDMTYTVTVIDNTTGCIASDETDVVLYPAVIISSGFSPNGDGKNDRWIIDYIDQFQDNTVEIYNRWGEQLYSWKNYDNNNTVFDGRYHNKDLPVGTYYYVIKLNHPAYPKAFTGPLTIFR